MKTLTTRYGAPPERLLPSLFPAAVATLLLIYLMHQLITTETPELEDPPARIAAFLMKPPEPLATREETPPVKPDNPERAPDWSPQQISIDNPSIGMASNQPIDFGDPVNDIDPNASGAGIVAYLRVQPNYPGRALQRGIEGFVDLTFDITAAGATTNIRVIDAQPKGMFERAAIRALEKWKYKVPYVEGEAAGQVGMTTRMTFSLEG